MAVNKAHTHQPSLSPPLSDPSLHGHWQAHQLRERGPCILTGRETRLLPLLHQLDLLPPATAVLGQTRQARPVLMTLNADTLGHFLVVGPAGSGKSELLRSALISLCLTSRPAQLCVLGIDVQGHELAVVESMPHALADLATDPSYAAALIRWLTEEMQRRSMVSIRRPHLVMVIDDLMWLTRSAWRKEAALIKQLISEGPAHGIHLFSASVDPLPVTLSAAMAASQVVQAMTFPGEPAAVVIQHGDEQVTAAPVWLSARDLNVAVTLARSGWLASHRFLDGASPA